MKTTGNEEAPAMDHPLLNAFWMMLWFFLWIIWLMILFRVIVDLFSDHELSGWGKALWLIFMIVLPYLGVFVYLIARGRQMTERARKQAERSDKEFKDYVKQAAGTGASPADELTRLAALRADGTLTEAEFQQAKSRLLAA
jgi:hypothetical protein